MIHGHWVTGRTSCGEEYHYVVWEHPVPRIQDEFLKTAIYLYKNRADAEASHYEGGSGFLVGYVGLHNRILQVYGVTNAHVIRDGFSVIRINKVFGGHDVLDLPRNAWQEHPEGDDIAICATTLSPSHDFKFVLSDGLVTEERVERHNIGIGDDVFMVGRFTGHPGEKKNLPVARFGNISMVPSEELKNPLGKTRTHYLVEVRSVSGFSGSPVFIYDTPTPPSLVNVRKERFPNLLLGIDCGHMPEHEKQLSAGIAAVVPAWRLLELLEHPEVKKKREEWEKQLQEEARSQRTIVPDSNPAKEKQ